IDSTILKILNDNPDIIVEISSHTDSKGSDEYNMRLSQKRAESVVDYLTRKGISKDRLRAKGYGETMPIAPNNKPDGSDNPEGREKNRRTEFKIIGKIDREIIGEE
ncbi:MAG TPA: OmpA family protein, partial [Bacteroidia bacterium]